MSMLFVTASGTEVGKTFVCAALIRELLAAGRTLRVLKPLATGFDRDDAATSDAACLLRAQGLEPNDARIEATSPWRFRAPLSPDMAAAREQRRIEFGELVDFCVAPTRAEIVLVEGIGGVMVPIDSQRTVLDWIEALGCPALLVVGSYLGTLSHSLTAVGMLEARGVPLAGIVVDESAEQPVSLAETVAALAARVDPIPVVGLPRDPHGHSLELAARLGLRFDD